MTRSDAFMWLRKERRDLLEQRRALHRDFAALRAAKFPRDQWTAHRQNVFDYRQRLANHWLAYEWVLHPPMGDAHRLIALSKWCVGIAPSRTGDLPARLREFAA